MMEQYFAQKEKYPDAVLLFRMGDFYETFYDDAKTIAKALDITLTTRSHGKGDKAPLAGIPYHSLDPYLGKLVKQGFKVAICEQVEDPKEAKGLVKREVVRVVTPGTLVEEDLLDSTANNYLVAVSPGEEMGIAFLDLSTGEFKATQISGREKGRRAKDELMRLAPAEILLSEEHADFLQDVPGHKTVLEPDRFSSTRGASLLKKHFETKTLEGTGLTGRADAIAAAGAVIDYLSETQMRTLGHITSLGYYDTGQFMILDETTLRNLELVHNIATGDKRGTLLSHVDMCSTPMGRRKMKRWLLQPLLDVEEIRGRQDSSRFISKDRILLHDVKSALDGVRDVERLSTKCSYGSAKPRDIRSLADTLGKIPEVHLCFEGKNLTPMIRDLLEGLPPFEELRGQLDEALVEEPPVSSKEGGVFKDGYDDDLDELREISRGGKDWILSKEKEEREKTGIKNLKIGYNKVFGYYIEVTHANTGKVPDHYDRKQTLVNSERYITPELKEMEAKVLSAQEKIESLEYELFCKLRDEIGRHQEDLSEASRRISTLDVLVSFAELAQNSGYVFPDVKNNGRLEIIKGRHPTVETMTPEFVPNDVILDLEDNRTVIVTGPNMSGKSTYMRQTALITILAQMGAPVPAQSARIGVVDRIFTRVGAFDDLVHGQSTFMVEMVELANILNCATERSLIILDEIGRGTSTYDGLAIAWAVVEYVNSREKLGAKTLFATHYHELTELSEILTGVSNIHIAIREDRDGIIFLREIREGAANKSYGVEVAKLAGLPKDVVKRAQEVLSTIEEEAIIEVRKGSGKSKYTQLVLFEQDASHPVVEELKKIQLEETTPIEALNLLNKFKDRVSKEKE